MWERIDMSPRCGQDPSPIITCEFVSLECSTVNPKYGVGKSSTNLNCVISQRNIDLYPTTTLNRTLSVH